jgi:hypothetical protein
LLLAWLNERRPGGRGNPSANLRTQPGRWSVLIDNHGVQMRSIVLILISLLIWAASGTAFAALPAPIGHRQPNASNVPASVLNSEQKINTEDIELDKKLNICRGC